MFEALRETIEKYTVELINTINKEFEYAKEIDSTYINQLEDEFKNHNEILVSLESNFKTGIDKKQKQINILNDTIGNLRNQLELELKNFQPQHNHEQLKERLMRGKESELSDFLLAKKKEINDLNSKINALNKECLLILKEKDNAIAETEKNYKAKVLELERRMRLEVAKINDNILIPVPKAAGVVDIEAEDNKFSKQAIKDIRIEGINDIAKKKTKYFEDIYKEHENFSKVRLQNDKDSKITREEYNQKTSALKFSLNKIKREIKKAEDSYNFDVYKNINSVKRDKLLEEKAIVNEYHLRIYQHSDTINRIEVNKNIHNENITKDILNVISEYDLIQLSKNHDNHEKQFNALNQTFINYYNYLIKIYDEFCNNIKVILESFWERHFDTQKIFIESLIIMNFASTTSNNISYNDYSNQIKQLYLNYCKNQKVSLDKLDKILKDNIALIKNQVLVFHDSLMNYSKQEFDSLVTFNSEVAKVIANSFDQNLSSYNIEASTSNKNTNDIIKNKKDSHDIEVNELKTGIDSINDDYLKEEQSIELNKQNYYNEFDQNEEQELLNHKKYLESVKKNIANLNLEYKNNLISTKKDLKKNLRIDLKKVEEERKEKLKIGKL